MPISPGVFGNSKPLVVARYRRAYADVQIVAASGTSPAYFKEREASFAA